MFKGFKEFLSRGNIVDLSIAVVIGTAFTALVTKFTDSIITPLINRIGVSPNSDVDVLKISIGGGQTIDFERRDLGGDQLRPDRGVVYFLVVLPTTRCAGRVRSSRPTTPKSSCSPKSATCWPRPAGARPASTAEPRRHRHPTTDPARTQNHSRSAPYSVRLRSDLQAGQLADDVGGKWIQRCHPVAHRVTGTGEVDHQGAAGNAGQTT